MVPYVPLCIEDSPIIAEAAVRQHEGHRCRLMCWWRAMIMMTTLLAAHNG